MADIVRLAGALEDAELDALEKGTDYDSGHLVRAVLREMREPSEEVVLRGLDHGPIGCCNLSDHDVIAIWRLMIDAMLEDHP